MHPMARLSVAASVPQAFPPVQLASLIENAPPGMHFILDANMFIGNTSTVIWEALSHRQIAVTPLVYNELSSWLRAPQHNHAAHERFRRGPQGGGVHPAQLLDFRHREPEVQRAIAYYVKLLGARKQLFNIVTPFVWEAIGREPTPRDLESFVKRHFGERGYQLAKKGEQAADAPEFFSDEELVVMAFVCAIGFVDQVTILTRDPDVHDQFFKMHWLLSMHYYGMLAAGLFAEDPASFYTRPMPDDPRIDAAFVSSDSFLVGREKPLGTALLPDSFRQTLVYCWLLSGPDDNQKVCQSVCALETGMKDLLFVKGGTGGLSTDRLDGLNYYVDLTPLWPSDGWGAVARDRRLSAPFAGIPFFDAQLLLYAREWLGSVSWAEDSREVDGPTGCR